MEYCHDGFRFGDPSRPRDGGYMFEPAYDDMCRICFGDLYYPTLLQMTPVAE